MTWPIKNENEASPICAHGSNLYSPDWRRTSYKSVLCPTSTKPYKTNVRQQLDYKNIPTGTGTVTWYLVVVVVVVVV